MKFRCHQGERLNVGGIVVTDDAAGVRLPDNRAVREHVARGRLLQVKAAKAKKSEVSK